MDGWLGFNGMPCLREFEVY